MLVCISEISIDLLRLLDIRSPSSRPLPASSYSTQVERSVSLKISEMTPAIHRRGLFSALNHDKERLGLDKNYILRFILLYQSVGDPGTLTEIATVRARATRRLHTVSHRQITAGCRRPSSFCLRHIGSRILIVHLVVPH